MLPIQKHECSAGSQTRGDIVLKAIIKYRGEMLDNSKDPEKVLTVYYYDYFYVGSGSTSPLTTQDTMLLLC